jgi:N-sulfoglucosamine sulfohydrolase
MVSAIDFLPTFCDMVHAPHPDGLQGTSFEPLLHGKDQQGRTAVFKEYNENAGGNRHPMRGVETPEYLYLFNPWSDGEDIMRTATQGTKTYKRMKELAPASEEIRQRLDLFEHRVVEELYNVQEDPDCLINLVKSESHQSVLEDMRARLKTWMEDTNDPAIVAFEGMESKAIRRAYVDKSQEESNARRAARRKNKPTKKKKQNLIQVIPRRTGEGVSVLIKHTIPKQVNTQKIHVTLKHSKKQIERKIIDASGTGDHEVAFLIPAEMNDDNLSVAAFVGDDYPNNLQHVVVTID